MARPSPDDPVSMLGAAWLQQTGREFWDEIRAAEGEPARERSPTISVTCTLQLGPISFNYSEVMAPHTRRFVEVGLVESAEGRIEYVSGVDRFRGAWRTFGLWRVGQVRDEYEETAIPDLRAWLRRRIRVVTRGSS